MQDKCSNPDCPAPPRCHEGNENYEQCEYWKLHNIDKVDTKVSSKPDVTKGNLTWTGEPFQIDDIYQVSRRSNPVVIGIVGRANAGKTTFLAMLYTLLLNGKKFDNFDFAGSKTIEGWDFLHHKLKVYKSKVAFHDPTPSQYLRLLHFALRDTNEQLKDILFSEASGEVFTLWSQNREDNNADNARWIYENSNAFILFIDCEDFIDRRNLAKTEIIDLAQMLQHDLKGRPVVAVWSKSDEKAKVHPKLRESLTEELNSLFTNYTELDISNFSTEDPDELVHKNNMKVINWLLEKIFVPTMKELIVSSQHKNDYFINYKGQ